MARQISNRRGQDLAKAVLAELEYPLDRAVEHALEDSGLSGDDYYAASCLVRTCMGEQLVSRYAGDCP